MKGKDWIFVRHLCVGALCLVCVTLPFDLVGIRSPWVVAAGVTAGVAGMLTSAWWSDRRT